MYCGTLGRAFRMGSASDASRPFRSYTAAQARLSTCLDPKGAVRGSHAGPVCCTPLQAVIEASCRVVRQVNPPVLTIKVLAAQFILDG